MANADAVAPDSKPWTVAIYMAADGRSGSKDLDQVAVRELAQIVHAAGSVTSSIGHRRPERPPTA